MALNSRVGTNGAVWGEDFVLSDKSLKLGEVGRLDRSRTGRTWTGRQVTYWGVVDHEKGVIPRISLQNPGFGGSGEFHHRSQATSRISETLKEVAFLDP